MDQEKARTLLEKTKPDALVLNVREYKGCYIFQTCPKETVLMPFSPIYGGYYSVNKLTGKIGPFNPKADTEFFEQKETDLSGLRDLEAFIMSYKD